MENHLTYLIKRNPSAFYLFDIKTLKQRIIWLREHLLSDIRLCYAMKANPFIVKAIETDADSFECCSPGEARICNSLSIDTGKIVISGVNKTPGFIEDLIADKYFFGVFTAESVNQYYLLSQLSEKYSKTIKVLLRLTNKSQFGMNPSEIESIICDSAKHSYIDIIGIQYFSGTQKYSVKKIKKEIDMLDSFLTDLREKYSFIARELEYGPGFPVSYFESEEFDEESYLSSFNEIINSMKNKPEIILELGRSIAASCGKYFTHIVDMKNNSGQNYLLVNGGMHHIVYFGQYMAMKQPMVSVVGKENETPHTECTVCGSLCSMNDILVKNMKLPLVTIGDVLCFENTGAYCMTEGSAMFLSRDLPAVYLLDENRKLYCIRPAFETEILNTPQYERID